MRNALWGESAAPVFDPEPSDYERFAAGFPYAETPDQSRAIEAVRDDLASGRSTAEDYRAMWRDLECNGFWQGEIWDRRKDGSMTVEPKAGRAYANRTKTFKYKIDHNDLAYKLFKMHGFTWGGDWRSLKDYQHLEKK